MDQEQEAAIVARIRKGDRDAFSLLVDAYKAPVFNLTYRMTGNREDADELAQETFVRAYANLDKFQSDQMFFTWLFTISLNVIKNHLRRQAVWGKLVTSGKSAPDMQDPGSNPENDLLEKEEQRQLQQALLGLPYDQREVLTLRLYEDLSFTDIADICRLPESTVKMRLYRALEKLRTLIGSAH